MKPRRKIHRKLLALVAFCALTTMPVGPAGRTVAAPTPLAAGTRAETTTSGFMYITGLAAGDIAALEVAGDGRLRQLGTVASTGASGIGFTASPDGRVVYVAPSSGGKLFAFQVRPDGRLIPVPGTPVEVPGSPSGIALNSAGDHLYVTGGKLPGFTGGGQVTVYELRDRVPVQKGAPFDIGQLQDGVSFPVVSHDDRHLYIGLQQGMAIAELRLHRDGTIASRGPRVPTSWPLFPVISPNGRFLYIPNEYLDTISGFQISPVSGELTELPSSPFHISGQIPHGITFTPDGRYAYVPNVDGNQVDGYSVEKDGTLRQLPGSPFQAGGAGQFPGRALVSPDGGTLYVIDVMVTARIYSYRIQTDGSLVHAQPPLDTGILLSDGPDSLFVPVPRPGQ